MSLYGPNVITKKTYHLRDGYAWTSEEVVGRCDPWPKKLSPAELAKAKESGRRFARALEALDRLDTPECTPADINAILADGWPPSRLPMWHWHWTEFDHICAEFEAEIAEAA